MYAAVLTEPGVPRFDEFAEPRASDGQVVVDVSVAGLNPVDIVVAAGRHVGLTPVFPSVTGREGVGNIDGRTVYFGATISPFGSMAERALVDRRELFDVPEGLDHGIAVALGVAGLAAWLPIAWRAKLQAGETVLVLGATGVLGTIAVQVAKILGAGRVVAVGRDANGLVVAAERGADVTVDLNTTDDLSAKFREATGGRGADVIIDTLWGEPAIAALGATAPFSRLVQIGNTASPATTLSAPTLRETSTAILGYTSRMVPLHERASAYASLTDHAMAGRISVDVERIPLRDIRLAWDRQERFAHRKLVLEP